MGETRKSTPQEDSYAAALERGGVFQREVIAGVRAELGDDSDRLTDAAIWQACVRLATRAPAVVAVHLRLTKARSALVPDPLQVDERRTYAAWLCLSCGALVRGEHDLHDDATETYKRCPGVGEYVEVVPASVVAARDEEIAHLKAHIEERERATDAEVAALTEEVERLRGEACDSCNGKGFLDAGGGPEPEPHTTHDCFTCLGTGRKPSDDERRVLDAIVEGEIEAREAEVARLYTRANVLAQIADGRSEEIQRLVKAAGDARAEGARQERKRLDALLREWLDSQPVEPHRASLRDSLDVVLSTGELPPPECICDRAYKPGCPEKCPRRAVLSSDEGTGDGG